MAISQQDSKIVIKSSTSTGVVPTAGPTADHTDGSWNSTDIYSGELMLNLHDNRAWFRSLYYMIGIATINGTAPLSNDKVLISDSSGHVTTSAMTATELANLSSGGTTLSGTYAYWAARKTAGTLLTNRWINITDAGDNDIGDLYLFCTTQTSFSQSGIIKRTVSSVDYYNECGFYFDFTSFGQKGCYLWVKDHLNNHIQNYSLDNGNTQNFVLNTTNTTDNYCDSRAEFLVNGNNAATIVIGNRCTGENSSISVRSAASTASIRANEVSSYGRLNLDSIAGAFSRCRITNASVAAPMNNGITISDCTFEGGTYSLDPADGYSQKAVKKGVFSNFDKTISITGLTTLTNSASYGAHIGIINLTSSNATETINLFANAPQGHPFRIYPASGLTVTFTHATGANQPICSGGVNAVIDGTLGEWIEFTYNANTSRYYQTNIGQY